MQPNADTFTIVPMQHSKALSLLQFDWQAQFKWGVFRLDSKIRGQKLSGYEDAMPLPNFIGRTSIFYEDYWFKKAMFLNLGLSARYFSSYKMRAYHPLISEFVVQPFQELNGYPIINVFFNAKIRQTRLFLIVEHVNANKKSPNYFSAPSYPYRDMLIRFGLVWNFFQ